LGDSIQLSILAGLGTVMGALLVFIKRDWSSRSLAFYLGLASGVMVAVVVFDLLPSALVFASLTKVLSGGLLGILIMMAVDLVLKLGNSRSQTLLGLGYLIMLGIAVHDLPEGMAIAMGGEMKARTGAVIALGIGIHNIPEGMAIAAPLLMAGMKKWFIVVQMLLIALITPVGTILGKYLFQTLPSFLPLLLGMASGIMVCLVIFHLWPQARLKDRNSCRWGFLGGLLIILAATYL